MQALHTEAAHLLQMEHDDRETCALCGDVRPCPHVDNRMDGNWHYCEQVGNHFRYDIETEEFFAVAATVDGGMEMDGDEINEGPVDFGRIDDEQAEIIRRFFMNQEPATC